jgi:DNA-binding transcriptional LysR family regulator
MKKIIGLSHDLMLFSYLVDFKSFTALAAALDLNKSVISKRIKQLENEIGTQLLLRNSRKFSLTQAGQRLYERCRTWQLELKESLEELQEMTQAPSGTLRLSSPNNFALEHLIPLIAEFNQIYPDIKFKLMIGRNYQCIIKHGVDLGFHVGPLPDSRLIARPLASRKMLVCASPEYFKQYGRPQHPEELREHNCLRPIEHNMSSEWVFYTPDQRQITVDVRGNFKATSLQVVKQAALSHLGVVMLPGHVVTQELRQGSLSIALEAYDTAHLTISALYAQGVSLPHRARLFLEFVQERFNRADYWQASQR